MILLATITYPMLDPDVLGLMRSDTIFTSYWMIKTSKMRQHFCTVVARIPRGWEAARIQAPKGLCLENCLTVKAQRSQRSTKGCWKGLTYWCIETVVLPRIWKENSLILNYFVRFLRNQYYKKAWMLGKLLSSLWRRPDWAMSFTSCVCVEADIFLLPTVYPWNLLRKETIEQKEDTNIMFLSLSCLIAANEDFLHHDDAM